MQFEVPDCVKIVCEEDRMHCPSQWIPCTCLPFGTAIYWIGFVHVAFLPVYGQAYMTINI